MIQETSGSIDVMDQPRGIRVFLKSGDIVTFPTATMYDEYNDSQIIYISTITGDKQKETLAAFFKDAVAGIVYRDSPIRVNRNGDVILDNVDYLLSQAQL
jgi:hypothetical protein